MPQLALTNGKSLLRVPVLPTNPDRHARFLALAE